MEKVVIGVDPGMDGCWAAIDGEGNLISRIVNPRVGGKSGRTDMGALVEWMDSIFALGPSKVIASFEDIHPLYNVSASSTGKLMENKGQIEGILYAYAKRYGNMSIIPFAPKTWQKKVWTAFDRVVVGGKLDTKKTSLAAAKRIWPSDKFLATERCKVAHDGIVDAMLIAEATRRTY